jgi:hypothetical protein
MQRPAATFSSLLPRVPALCTLPLRRHLSQTGRSIRLSDSTSTCSITSNIPSAVSILPQNKKIAPSDTHCAVFKAEASTKMNAIEPYDASDLLRAPLRALNLADHHSGLDTSKRTLQHAPRGVPELDSALRGVHVHKLSDGVLSRNLPCAFRINLLVRSAGIDSAAFLFALSTLHRTMTNITHAMIR